MSKVLDAFEANVRDWYNFHDHRNDCDARKGAYLDLMERYGFERVGRHVRAISQALTNAELRYATGAAAERLREG